MPYQDTYVPLLHLVSAATATLGHLSAVRAYHGVTGATYALGAGTLFLMAVRLGAPRGAAFLAGLFYSLFSPSALFMPGVAGDIGGLWFARRLQVLTVYGEGPHISAMTLIPLVILALEAAVGGRTKRLVAVAAIPIAVVFLTNVPGTMALGLTVFCWICAQPADRLKRAWMVAGVGSALAYGFACFGIPPSALLTVGGNVGSMHRGFSNSMAHGPVWLALALLAVAGAGYLLARTKLPLVVRFAILFFALVAPLAIQAKVEVFELLPQVGRLHLEAEMGACLLLGSIGWAIYTFTPRWLRPVILVVCIAPAFLQWQHYRWFAHSNIQYAELEKRSEYTSARWLDRNLNGQRVYVSGSTSFWLNSFTDTPQLVGCCDQGLAMPVLTYVPFIINSMPRPEDTLVARSWMQALGVHAIVANGAASTDEYKDIQAPERYRAVLPLLHEENGDAIYQVLPADASMAHVLRPGEQVRVRPASEKIPDADAIRYAQAVTDDGRQRAEARWIRNDVVRIRANLAADDLVSVQMAYFRGWKAEVAGRTIPVDRDGLGFILLRPRCQGDCDIELRWTGRPDVLLSAFVSLFALALAAVMIWR